MIDLDAIRERQQQLSVCDLQHYGDSCDLLAYVDALLELLREVAEDAPHFGMPTTRIDAALGERKP